MQRRNRRGWVLVVDGVVQIGTGVLVWLRNESVRWVGVALASSYAIVQLLFVQVYALWALAFFTLDLLVMYALVVYGEPRWPRRINAAGAYKRGDDRRRGRRRDPDAQATINRPRILAFSAANSSR